MADGTLAACLAEIKANHGKFYVYILSKPDGTPFYVGCGAATANRHGHRIADHEREAKRGRRHRKCDTIRKLWRAGLEVVYSIDSWHHDPVAMFDREVVVIASLGRLDKGRGPLTNGNDGGTGQLAPSADVRAAMSKSAAERWDSSERARASASAKKFAIENPDHVLKLVAFNKQRLEDPAARTRIVERLRATYHANPHVAERLRQGQIQLLTDPERRRAWKDAQSAAMARPETKKKLSEAQAANWKDPEYRARHVSRVTQMCRELSPEVEARRIAAIRAYWAARREAKNK